MRPLEFQIHFFRDQRNDGTRRFSRFAGLEISVSRSAMEFFRERADVDLAVVLEFTLQRANTR